jgi:hypothetical protein
MNISNNIKNSVASICFNDIESRLRLCYDGAVTYHMQANIHTKIRIPLMECLVSIRSDRLTMVEISDYDFRG